MPGGPCHRPLTQVRLICSAMIWAPSGPTSPPPPLGSWVVMLTNGCWSALSGVGGDDVVVGRGLVGAGGVDRGDDALDIAPDVGVCETECLAAGAEGAGAYELAGDAAAERIPGVGEVRVVRPAAGGAGVGRAGSDARRDVRRRERLDRAVTKSLLEDENRHGGPGGDRCAVGGHGLRAEVRGDRQPTVAPAVGRSGTISAFAVPSRANSCALNVARCEK